MHKIEYEIKLNESGRPYVSLSDDYDNKPEDKFFVFELARYLLEGTYFRRKAQLDSNAAEIIENSVSLLGQVSDEMAEILFNNMKAAGDMDMMMDKRYHICVDTIEERDALPEFIVYGDKIYQRQEGLKVFVLSELTGLQLFELKDGITNDNWTIVK
jgi:hypothetical protein